MWERKGVWGCLCLANWLMACGGDTMPDAAVGSAGQANSSGSPSSGGTTVSQVNRGGATTSADSVRASGGASSAAGGTSWFGIGGTGGTPKGGTGGATVAPTTGFAGTTTQPGALRVSFAAARPGGILLGNQLSQLLGCDGKNNLSAIGPRLSHDLSQADPGPRLSRLSPQGEELDSQEFPDAVTPEVIAVDSKGARILAGQLYRAVNFGVTPLAPVENGYFLVKLDSVGKEVWARRIETPDTFWLRDLAVDASDDIYVSGAQTDMTDGWQEHATISKYTASTGERVWNQQYRNTNSTGTANGLAILPTGAIAVAGAFNGKMQVGSVLLTTGATSQGYESYNGWFARLNASDGTPSGVQRFGGTIFDMANAVGVTSSGSMRLAGQLSGTSTIAGTSIEAQAKGSPFVAEVGEDDNAKWIRVFGKRGMVFDAATDALNRTIAVGRFDPDDYTGDNLDESPAFVAVVDAAGTLSQLLTFTTRSNGAHAVATDKLGGVWVSGEFIGTTSFGAFELTATNYQVFLIRLSP